MHGRPEPDWETLDDHLCLEHPPSAVGPAVVGQPGAGALLSSAVASAGAEGPEARWEVPTEPDPAFMRGVDSDLEKELEWEAEAAGARALARHQHRPRGPRLPLPSAVGPAGVGRSRVQSRDPLEATRVWRERLEAKRAEAATPSAVGPAGGRGLRAEIRETPAPDSFAALRAEIRELVAYWPYGLSDDYQRDLSRELGRAFPDVPPRTPITPELRTVVYEALRGALQNRDTLCSVPGNRRAVRDWDAGWHDLIHRYSLFFGGPGLTDEVDGGPKLLQHLRAECLAQQGMPPCLDLTIIAPNVPR